MPGLDMLHVVIQHGEQESTFGALKGLDKEPVVMAEEEEAATRACSLTYLEDFVAILFDVERFNDLPDGHFVDG